MVRDRALAAPDLCGDGNVVAKNHSQALLPYPAAG